MLEKNRHISTLRGSQYFGFFLMSTYVFFTLKTMVQTSGANHFFTMGANLNDAQPQTWVKYLLKVFRIYFPIFKKILFRTCIQIHYTNCIPNTSFRILLKYF
jgi:hypothetical protein